MKYTKIKSDQQYSLYCERHEELTYQNYTEHQDEIELIEILIDEYESRTIHFNPKMNPVEVIEYLLKENNITKSQIARDLDVSRQLITDILAYRRDLSKSMIIKLSRKFKLSTAIFTKEYQLKKVS